MQKFKIAYLFILLGMVVVLLIWSDEFCKKDENPTSNEGRIKFSHKLHKELTDCQSCHSAVKESVSLKDLLFPS